MSNRFMCLADGRFFVIEIRPSNCPYCLDNWYSDNILPDVPPPIGNGQYICGACKVEFTVETDDVTGCPVCKSSCLAIIKSGIILQEYQNSILEKLGL